MTSNGETYAKESIGVGVFLCPSGVCRELYGSWIVWFGGIVRERLSACNRLAAAGCKPFGLLLWVRVSPVGGVPYGKGLRAPPCARKGHRPLTRDGADCALRRDCLRQGASRSACFCGVRVSPVGGVPYGKGLRAPPCARKGHRPLTRDCASRSACFCGVRIAPYGGIAFGKGLRAPPCTRKGHRPLTRDCASRSACF